MLNRRVKYKYKWSRINLPFYFWTSEFHFYAFWILFFFVFLFVYFPAAGLPKWISTLWIFFWLIGFDGSTRRRRMLILRVNGRVICVVLSDCSSDYLTKWLKSQVIHRIQTKGRTRLNADPNRNYVFFKRIEWNISCKMGVFNSKYLVVVLVVLVQNSDWIFQKLLKLLN